MTQQHPSYVFTNESTVSNQVGQQTIHGNLNVYHSGHEREIDKDELLQTMTYDGMNDRVYELDQEGSALGSLDWIWNTDFPAWLRSSEDTYSIVGKPGSGKSTLANYLADHRQTMDHLKANGKNWYICKFFFTYRAGDTMANNIEGFYRSILIQILRRLPSTYIPNIASQFNNAGQNTPAQLLEYLRDALSQSKSSVCVFVDGLDEFSGDMSTLSRKLSQLRDQPGLKVCLSSRPGFAISALSKQRTLLMQDHNKPAIRRCVQEVLKEHALITWDNYYKIQDAIVEKAEGVILWAQLVCQNVKSWISSGDTFENLNERLKTLAPEMKELYDDIIRRLDAQYPFEAQLVLHLVRTRHGSVQVGELYRAFQKVLLLADVNIALLKNMDEEIFAIRLRNNYGGLLSSFDSEEEPNRSWLSDQAYNLSKPLEWRQVSKRHVILCHETLRTYLVDHLRISGSTTPALVPWCTRKIWLVLYCTVIKQEMDGLISTIEAKQPPRYSDGHCHRFWRHTYSKPSSILKDATNRVMMMASDFDEEGVHYAEDIKGILGSRFPEYHIWQCQACLGPIMESKVDASVGLATQNQDPPVVDSFGNVLLPWPASIWIAICHGLVDHLRQSLMSLSIAVRRNLTDFTLEAGLGSLLRFWPSNNSYTFRTTWERSLQALLESGMTLSTRNANYIFKHSMVKDFPVHLLRNHWSDDDVMEQQHDASLRCQPWASDRSWLLYKWVRSGSSQSDLLDWVLQPRSIVNEPCCPEGTALHGIIRRDLLTPIRYFQGSITLPLIQCLGLDLEPGEMDICGTPLLLKFLLLLRAGADPRIRSTGKDANKTLSQRVKELKRWTKLRKYANQLSQLRESGWKLGQAENDLKTLLKVLDLLPAGIVDVNSMESRPQAIQTSSDQ